MSDEAQPPDPSAPPGAPSESPPEMTAGDFLETAGLSDKQTAIVLRQLGWNRDARLPVDQLRAGLARALHGRI